MDIFLRNAIPGDGEVMAELSCQLGYSCSAPEMSQRVGSLLSKADYCVFVAEREGKILGWVYGFYTERLETAPFVEIGGLVVDGHFRGCGIGRQLVEQVKNWAVGRQVSRLRVRCNTQRMAAHSFYRKRGFKETKEQKIFDMEISG